MTVEESIFTIESVMGHNDSLSVFEEALDVAISALEKMNPEEPKPSSKLCSDGITIIHSQLCPVCGRNLFDNLNDSYFNYCPDCGQKLDWDD